MKRITTIALAILAASALSAACLAQDAGPSGSAGTLQVRNARPKGAPVNFKMLGAAFKQILPTLNLSQPQSDQIDALVTKDKAEAKEIRRSNADRPTKIQKLRDLGASFRKQFAGILKPAQRKQFMQEFRQFIKKWRADHQRKPQPTAPAG